MINTPLVGRSGGHKQILRLAIELQRFGHEVEIFTSAVNKENCYCDLIEKLNVKVIPHPLKETMPKMLIPMEIQQKGRQEPANETTEPSSLRAWMRRAMGRQFYTFPYQLPSMLNIGRKIPIGFDIINNHNFPTEWAAFLAKKRLKVPVVWMCNEPPDWFYVPESRMGLRRINWPIYDIFDKTSARYIDEILVLSSIAQKYVSSAYRRPSRIIRSGVDVEPFQTASGSRIREKYGLGKDFVLLQVGNFQRTKGQVDSIRVLNHLSKRFSGIRLILDGAGRKEDLIQLGESFGVTDKILFLHTKDDKELTEVYAACDVFLFPAQITWGLAAVEAMAASKPVVATNKSGVSEIIQSGINGIVVDYAKTEDAAKQVESLLNDAQLRRKIGDNGFQFVKKNLSWEKYAKHVETVLEKAVLVSKQK